MVQYELITQYNNTFDLCVATLSNDVDSLNKYFKEQRLKPNQTKIEVTLFHHNNKRTPYKINQFFDGPEIKNIRNSKYLGVTLDRNLHYKEHLVKTSAKLKTSNSIIQKQANLEWGADSNTLRIT